MIWPFKGNDAPMLLDLFCGAGGAAVGYSRAGFNVVGVDIEPQPNYPFPYHRVDAVQFMWDHVLDRRVRRGNVFAAIHASPPCQRYCAPSQYNRNRDSYPDLVAPIRAALMESGLPYIIENTPGAPLHFPLTLCGQMFGLRMYRHRLFETNVKLDVPPHTKHDARGARNGVIPPPNGYFTITGGKHSQAWTRAAKTAMGVPWMETTREVCEAIPPVYTEHLGVQLMRHVMQRAA